MWFFEELKTKEANRRRHPETLPQTKEKGAPQQKEAADATCFTGSPEHCIMGSGPAGILTLQDDITRVRDRLPAGGGR